MSLPSIVMNHSTLMISGHTVNLRGRARTRALLKAFLDNRDRPLKRDEIRRYVYAEPPAASTRLREAQNSSLAKLICRTRSLLQSALAGSDAAGLPWIVYCGRARQWSLLGG